MIGDNYIAELEARIEYLRAEVAKRDARIAELETTTGYFAKCEVCEEIIIVCAPGTTEGQFKADELIEAAGWESIANSDPCWVCPSCNHSMHSGDWKPA